MKTPETYTVHINGYFSKGGLSKSQAETRYEMGERAVNNGASSHASMVEESTGTCVLSINTLEV